MSQGICCLWGSLICSIFIALIRLICSLFIFLYHSHKISLFQPFHKHIARRHGPQSNLRTDPGTPFTAREGGRQLNYVCVLAGDGDYEQSQLHPQYKSRQRTTRSLHNSHSSRYRSRSRSLDRFIEFGAQKLLPKWSNHSEVGGRGREREL